jgi:hypothetical protein
MLALWSIFLLCGILPFRYNDVPGPHFDHTPLPSTILSLQCGRVWYVADLTVYHTPFPSTSLYPPFHSRALGQRYHGHCVGIRLKSGILLALAR